MKDYSLDVIVDNDLYLLLPFYLFNFESEIHLSKDEKDEGKIQAATTAVKHRLSEVTSRLMQEADKKTISAFEYQTLVNMLNAVAHAITRTNEKVEKGVDDIMGGQILSYKAAEIWKEAWNKSRKESDTKSIRMMYPLLLEKKDSDQAVSELATNYEYKKSDIIDILGPLYQPQS